MKFFIVFACALAAASAGLATPLVYGAQHLPVIGANGVPVDTAEVQNARAAHFAATVEAHVRNGDYVHGVVAPAVSTYASPLFSTYANPLISAYAYGVPAVTHKGVPLETAEVAVAKANHFAAHAEALARNGHSAVLLRHRRGIYAAAYPVYAGPQHHPVIGANGVPVDTAEVQHARAAHLATKAEVQARPGQDVDDTPVVAYSASVAQHVPVIANGVPVDTLEVQQAKAAHYAAKAEAHARNGDVAVVAPVVAYSAPIAYAAQHVPVIANGVPVDTAEVQHAKAAHFAAKAEAHARNGDYAVVAPVYGYAAQHVPVIANGVPVETPEVQHAKAAHFAAKAEAHARNGDYSVVAPVYGYATQHVPVIANGVPVETPEVQLAKVAHFAAHANAAVHALY